MTYFKNFRMTSLYAISPIDGRYHDKVKDLGHYFSEAALIKYRVQVEIEYFISLSMIPLPQLNLKLNILLHYSKCHYRS